MRHLSVSPAIFAIVMMWLSLSCDYRHGDYALKLWLDAQVEDSTGKPLEGATIVLRDLGIQGRPRLEAICISDRNGHCEGTTVYRWTSDQRRWLWQKWPEGPGKLQRRLVLEVSCGHYDSEQTALPEISPKQMAGVEPVRVAIRLQRNR